ncbi:MAG: hypothetical protein DSY80_05535 [Desulfocapsa sp.]|nr:MAG: hypothetical protein DSY80_05535 [Desulfocapsa sp.]
MARKTKKNRKTKKTAVKRRKKQQSKKNFPMKFFSFLMLFGLLLFSLGAAAYVIFFKTTIAHGATAEENGLEIMFEEPYTTIPELPADIPSVRDTSLPMVAIIIDDMGYHEKIGKELLALPMNLTFSFLAAAPFTTELEEKAYQAGRCIFLHLPMEPKSKEWDPGPGALLLGQTKAEQAKLFQQNLMAIPHAVGVNNHMGSLYTENREAMDSLMSLLAEQGLIFVDSFTTSASKGLIAAKTAGIPTARRHIFLDNVHSQDKVCKQLQKLVRSAEENGWAIGIGHPNAATLAALTNCRDRLMKKTRLVSAQEMVLELNRQ